MLDIDTWRLHYYWDFFIYLRNCILLFNFVNDNIPFTIMCLIKYTLIKLIKVQIKCKLNKYGITLSYLNIEILFETESSLKITIRSLHKNFKHA